MPAHVARPFRRNSYSISFLIVLLSGQLQHRIGFDLLKSPSFKLHKLHQCPLDIAYRANPVTAAIIHWLETKTFAEGA